MPLILEDNITTAAPGLEQCAPQPLRRSALPALCGRWRASPVRPCCAGVLLRLAAFAPPLWWRARGAARRTTPSSAWD